MHGVFILIVGPSGSGKGTILSRLRTQLRDESAVVFPVSCTMREKRPAEHEGETYYFVSREEFEKRIHNDEFLEWAEYGGNLYGTLKSEINTPLHEGCVVIREVEVQGAHSLMSLFPRSILRIVYIDAGEWEEFEQRIRNRAPISDEEISRRQKHYEDEISFKEEADHIISNGEGEFEKAAKQLEDVVRSEVDQIKR